MAVGVCAVPELSSSKPALDDLRDIGGERADSLTLEKEQALVSAKESSSSETRSCVPKKLNGSAEVVTVLESKLKTLLCLNCGDSLLR
jgi:hypothetical protein